MYVLENKDGFIKSWFSFGNGKKQTIINTKNIDHAVIFYSEYDALSVAKKLKVTVTNLNKQNFKGKVVI